MPIPELTERGYLPEGIHDATLDEVCEAFGRFRSSDRRVHLFQQLERYVRELQAWGDAAEILLDGSFVSSRESPGDIDVVVVYREGFDFAQPLVPAEYNLINRARARRIYGIDVFAVAAASVERDKWISYFSEDTRSGIQGKGVLRVGL